MKRMKQITHQVYYDLSDGEKKAYIEYISKKIKREKNRLFVDLEEIVKNKVKSYIADFYVHDFNALTIELGAGNRFIWNVYDCGTRLIRLDLHFEEETKSSFEYFEGIKKTYLLDKKSKNYLIDVRNKTVKELDVGIVSESMFTSKLGSVQKYFDDQLNSVEVEKVYEYRKFFRELCELYKGHPPKEEVDNILSGKGKSISQGLLY